MRRGSPASAPTASQPRGVALGADGTAFVAGASTVEAFRANQKVHEVAPPFVPSSVATSGALVVVGGEVRRLAPANDFERDMLMVRGTRTRSCMCTSGTGKR